MAKIYTRRNLGVSDYVVFRFSYDETAVQRLKEYIPARAREWDAQAREWVIFRSHETFLSGLLESLGFGEVSWEYYLRVDRRGAYPGTSPNATPSDAGSDAPRYTPPEPGEGPRRPEDPRVYRNRNGRTPPRPEGWEWPFDGIPPSNPNWGQAPPTEGEEDFFSQWAKAQNQRREQRESERRDRVRQEAEAAQKRNEQRDGSYRFKPPPDPPKPPPPRSEPPPGFGSPRSFAAASAEHRILFIQGDAPPEVIEAAYRALIKKCHPDVDRTPGATERAAKINAAYQKLKVQK